ncbi:MAG: CBS domain-containing protein [Methanomassiliicoccales archaeon]|jgi:CBS domain-containing protein
MEKSLDGNLVDWVLQSDRRLLTLKCFSFKQMMSVSEIAEKTNRSVQNISTALKELSEKDIVRPVLPEQRTWKKYGITPLGKSILLNVERMLSSGLFEQLADEMTYKLVRDAYRLVVKDPIIVDEEDNISEVIELILSEPRTRSAYVVDEDRKLIGMVGLRQLLQAIGVSISISQSMDGQKNLLDSKVDFSIKDRMFVPQMVHEEDSLLEALEMMISNEMEDLPVVDGNDVLIGELNGFEVLLMGRDLMKGMNNPREGGWASSSHPSV